MAVDADIFELNDPIGQAFSVSVALHVALFALAIFVPSFLGLHSGENWGGATTGGGDAMNATLVSSIPLPANPEATNVLANESKGLSQSQPKVEEKPEEDAIPIADKTKKQKPTKVPPKTPTKQEAPREVAKADNSIPYGQGGPVSGPYGTFSASGAKGGFGFTGGGGDFGSRYAWYVDQVRRKVAENWMKYEVDPSVSTARRVYIYFEIQRNGSPQNIKVEQSSGVPSLDQSAMRALQRIDTFGPLPGDYSGNRVSVEFWFDYKR